MITAHTTTIVLGGEAGQGIQTVETLLVSLLRAADWHVFATKEYMSRIRGGSNSVTIRVSRRRVQAYAEIPDILVALDASALAHLEPRIAPHTRILGDTAVLGSARRITDVPFQAIGSALGSALYANSAAAGAVLGIFGVPFDLVSAHLQRRFSAKKAEIITGNVEAARRGYAIGAELQSSGGLRPPAPPDQPAGRELLVNGAEAVAIGALAGGCTFVASYPMSPSTGVLTFLAQQAQSCGIIVEQAEDEIAAINMVLGAWYAGARGLVTTSGGGFALMVEAVSLAGAMESPLVVHLAQRPGPATGLPTRTEQGDLQFALYSGHGEFARIILAPSTLEEGMLLTQRAFGIADRFQVPVFILTDQYFMDTYYNIPTPELPEAEPLHIVETDAGYRRYALTPDGISPRGIPGYGSGLVRVDSDEHDEDGRITESMAMRVAMVDKRLRRVSVLTAEALPPRLNGPADGSLLVVGWGSTGPIIAEAIAGLGRSDVGHLHFTQVHPIHPTAAGILHSARKVVLVEGNATGQFGQLLALHAGVDISDKILRYDGLQFSVEQLQEEFTRRL